MGELAKSRSVRVDRGDLPPPARSVAAGCEDEARRTLTPGFRSAQRPEQRDEEERCDYDGDAHPPQSCASPDPISSGVDPGISGTFCPERRSSTACSLDASAAKGGTQSSQSYPARAASVHRPGA